RLGVPARTPAARILGAVLPGGRRSGTPHLGHGRTVGWWLLAWALERSAQDRTLDPPGVPSRGMAGRKTSCQQVLGPLTIHSPLLEVTFRHATLSWRKPGPALRA